MWELEALFHKLREEGYSGAFKNTGDLTLDLIDYELSCFIKEKGEIRALLLVLQSEDKKIRPVLLNEFSQTESSILIELMNFSARIFTDNHFGDEKIILRVHDDKSKGIKEWLDMAGGR